MASGNVSKNSKKGSKPQVVIKPEKEKKHKETILVEITKTVTKEIKDSQELTEYHGMEVIEIIRRYGKTYLRLRCL